ncbi:hypothetical protein JB92DRAFT_2938541 [Gautieria morchelliformis]|nr:hypothetical protein JB92DRAFT_2938541 [Gautieria morchelliformis]
MYYSHGKYLGDVVLGGDTDRSDKYIAPTVVQNVSFSDSLMSEELFGPILAIVPVPSMDAGSNTSTTTTLPLPSTFSPKTSSSAHTCARTRYRACLWRMTS